MGHGKYTMAGGGAPGANVATSSVVSAPTTRFGSGPPTALAGDQAGDRYEDYTNNITYGPFTGNGTGGSWGAGTPMATATTVTRISSNSPRDTSNHPVFTRYSGNPVVTAASSALNSIYWWQVLYVRNILASPIDSYYAWSSMDHDNGVGAGFPGGVELWTAPSPLGPWTSQGSVWVDTTSGYNDTETPSVIWDPVYGLFRMSYKLIFSTGQQFTWMATSPDGVHWTRGNQILVELSTVLWPDQGLVGYMTMFWLADYNCWGAYLLSGGGNYSESVIAYSSDGSNWYADPRPLNNMAQGTSDGGALCYSVFQGGAPFTYRGKQWITGLTTNFVSGSSIKVAHLFLARLTHNMRNILGVPQMILPLENQITGVTAAAAAVVTTTIPHGLISGQSVVISGVAGATNVNGTWTITVLTDNTFSVPVSTVGQTFSGTAGVSFPSGSQSWETGLGLRSHSLFVDPTTGIAYIYYVMAGSTGQPVTTGQLGIAVCNP